MATHSSTLDWKIPWEEEPGRLQSMGSWIVGHDWSDLAAAAAAAVSKQLMEILTNNMTIFLKKAKQILVSVSSTHLF